MARLVAFSWGFWGWGTATSELVAAVDAAEKRRGFGPPVFVDIRFKRSGRAPGFDGNAFEKLLGWRRYRWMPALGNRSIGTDRAMRIAFPLAANSLLDTVLEARDQKRRVIFFCACKSPHDANRCHRHHVAKLLRSAARRRGVALDVEEWPGGRPALRPLSLRVSAEVLHAVDARAKSVRLSSKRVPPQFAGIPWGTLVLLKGGRDKRLIAVGPLSRLRDCWVLPVFWSDDARRRTTDVRIVRRETEKLRRKYGVG